MPHCTPLATEIWKFQQMLRTVFLVLWVLTISGSQSRILKRREEIITTEHPSGSPAEAELLPEVVDSPPPGIEGSSDGVCPEPITIASLDIDRVHQ